MNLDRDEVERIAKYYDTHNAVTGAPLNSYTFFPCTECGALVFDPERHKTFHETGIHNREPQLNPCDECGQMSDVDMDGGICVSCEANL